MDRKWVIAASSDTQSLAKRPNAGLEALDRGSDFARISGLQTGAAHACWRVEPKQIKHCRRNVDDPGWRLIHAGRSATRGVTQNEHGVDFMPVEPAMHATADRNASGDLPKAR